jgi:molecular chaperone GrpE
MNEENKEAYEVGIPLEDLPSDDPSAATQVEESLPINASETDEEASGLPDLFDPEELAAAGLTGDLADPFDDQGDDESGIANGSELSAGNDDEVDRAAKDDMDEARFLPDDEDLSAERPDNELPDADLALPATASMAVLRPNDDAAGPGPVAPDREARPAAEADMDARDALEDRLDQLRLQMTELHREFEGKLKYDAHKDEIIDRLHAELQEYKQNIIKKYTLSIVMDVVKVTDDIRKWLSYFRSLDVSQRDPRKLFRYLEGIPSDLEDVFYWHGVKPFSSQEGAFDPARHRAIKKVPTDEQALDKKVAHSIRPGYEWETKVIRQEMVAVYVYQQAPESENTGMIDE